jgi:collagenase-like protein with putative collagen-binding domain
MAQYIKDVDPYDHHIVLHTFPNGLDAIYPGVIGNRSVLTGASLQLAWNAVHELTHKWIQASVAAGKPWVVANDEQGPANLGIPPDLGYRGFNGQTAQGQPVGYSSDDTRKFVLWGHLMAGGAGVEYYFGYQLPDNDIVAENFRSRDRSWDFGRIALTFFRDQRIPLVEMASVDELVGNPRHDNSKWALAKRGELYLVYLPTGGPADLDLSGVSGRFSVNWFDPENGGALTRGPVTTVTGGGHASLGAPPGRPGGDWLAVVRRN